MAEQQESTVAAVPSEPTAAGRLAWVDVVRAGGAFLVVLAHVVLYPSLKGAGPLWAQSLYYTTTRVAVPLFFMASGYLLLRKQEGLGDFFRKRALRVFIPFVIWSFVYLAWEGGFSGSAFTPMSILEGLGRILRGPRAAHLWFFYVLIGLYLITPTLRLFSAQARDRDLLYFCGMWLFLDPILSLIRYLTDLRVGFEFQFFTGYIGYYVLGFYLGRLVPRRALVIAGLVVLAATTAFVFVTVYVGLQQPSYDQFYEGYLSVFVVLMTASAFMVIRRIAGAIPAGAMRWINALSSASLGIYLLHVIVLDVMDAQLGPLMPVLKTGSSIWVMPVVGIAGFLVCFLVVGLMQRLPVVRYAVP